MIESLQLENGAKLLIEEIPYLRSAAVGVFIKVGSRYEDPEIAGASHFVEHMLFKGTAARNARDIAENFENIGGQLNAFTSKEYTCVYGRTLDEDIQTGMDIIFDMLFNSQFNLNDFTTEKEVIKEEIKMYEDTPDELIHDVFNQKYYEGDRMGHPILGTMQTIEALGRDDLYNYYKKHYLPANMVIAVAGNIDKSRIIDKVKSSLPARNEIPQNNLTIPSSPTPFINLLAKEVEQVQISLGMPGISYKDERRYTLNIMNSILGGGMSSRLFQSLREQKGLAYSVYSFSSTYSDSGVYSVYIGTGTGKVANFFAALQEELEKFIQDGVNEEELARTKQMIKSSMYMGLESVISRMTRIARSIMMYDVYVTPEEIVDRIYKVDGAMVKELASELIVKNKMSLAAIGNKDILSTVESEFKRWFR